MKIMICGSMTFSKEMREIKSKLEKINHFILLPCNIDMHLENPNFTNDLDTDLNIVLK